VYGGEIIGPGLLSKILRDTDLEADDLREIL
jgi:predicted RNA binding protein YcfA (HicA-like mRNA interferase family)